MEIGIIGAGRIGKVHARNIAMHVPQFTVRTVADPMMNGETEEYLKKLGVAHVTKDAREILDDAQIGAVYVCSSTNTHAQYVVQAAEAGKHIFCEKPIDYDLARVREAIGAAEKAGVKLQIGFDRRFDHNHRAVWQAVRDGKIGDVHIIRISSRDPEPPPIAYVKVSGGIFYDMMIHDFDMARFLCGSEVTEVYAAGSVLVDPAIGEAGDVDTAVVTLRFENGAIAVIDNSRRAVYGYDQRIEVFGSKGCVQDDNDLPSTVTLTTEAGAVSGTALYGMWDRYEGAFIAESRAFAEALEKDAVPAVTGTDGLYPVLMAAAATRSLREGRPVKISEIE